MPDKQVIVVAALLLAGCAAPRAPSPASPERWRVAGREGVVVLEAERHGRVRVEISGAPSEIAPVGEIVTVEVRVPGAWPGERHRWRVRPSRAGVEVLDPVVETAGEGPVRVRFVARTPGAGGVRITNYESRNDESRISNLEWPR